MERAQKVVTAAGILITLWIIFVEMNHNDETTPLGFVMEKIFAFGFLGSPWLILIFLVRKKTNAAGVVSSGVLMLGFEALSFHSTFISPEGSTAALIYAVKPFIQGLVLLPIGLLIGKALTEGKGHA